MMKCDVCGEWIPDDLHKECNGMCYDCMADDLVNTYMGINKLGCDNENDGGKA